MTASAAPRLESLEDFKLHVSMVSGKCLTLTSIQPGDTVLYLKGRIFYEVGILQNMQRLIFADTIMEDSKTMSDYNIQPEATVLLVGLMDDGNGSAASG